jgi:hypothetical protein
MPVPKADIPKVLARVKSLTDGTKKISKSDENRDGCVYLLDSPDEISRKMKRAKTDVALDFLLQREPFFQDAELLFQAIDQEGVVGYVTATTLTDIFYISRRHPRSAEWVDSLNFPGLRPFCWRLAEMTLLIPPS